jgi:CheY-like chemotaxis protein
MQEDDHRRQGGQVLVCDDNYLIAEVVCDVVRECGLEPVGPAGTLESAMHLARELALNGAVLDIKLRGQSCFAVCAILLARRIPFAFLTGYGAQVAKIPIEYRAAPLILKPFEAADLKAIFAEMLLADSSSPCGSRPTLRH